MKKYLSKKETDKLFNTMTLNGTREMEKTRFHKGVNEGIEYYKLKKLNKLLQVKKRLG